MSRSSESLSVLGDEIKIMVNDDRSTTSKEICKVNITGIIYDVSAADFDGDSKLDLFVLYKAKNEQIGYNGGILWGNRVNLSKESDIIVVLILFSIGSRRITSD